MSKHTPGPWVIEVPIRRGSWIGNKAGKWVCLTCGEENAQAAANARLIAAAPEMLQLLKTAAFNLRNLAENTGSTSATALDIQSLLTRIDS